MNNYRKILRGLAALINSLRYRNSRLRFAYASVSSEVYNNPNASYKFEIPVSVGQFCAEENLLVNNKTIDCFYRGTIG